MLNGYWSQERATIFQAIIMALELVPKDGTFWCEVGVDALRFQASRQEEVRNIRALFPGVIWRKSFNEFVGWWTYSGEYHGAPLFIYGVSENPPTCRLIEETYTVKERVPVSFEEREVTKTRMKPECGPEASDAS